jgi:23S rRNA (cytidine1920-2'-O)/16S rRNA (cytidine1409-2'-O)-methyltransferase
MTETIGKIRLDQHLVDHFGYESRSRARDAILRGCVSLNGQTCRKPGLAVPHVADITVDDAASTYVSRAALKLKLALATSGADLSGIIALDIGASTGGFTQLLLDAGVERVYAVDVGSDQLHPKVAADPRVINLENLNARDLKPGHFNGESPAVVTCDLSFISITTALPAALRLAAPGALGFFLVKPQFEVGRENIGKGGIVKNDAIVEQTVTRIRAWFEDEKGWNVLDCQVSPIAGADGNREFVLTAKKGSQ